MAIKRLKDSMSIISALSDEPNDVDGLTSSELKAKFDAAGTIIKEYVNSSLIPDVEAEIVKTVSDTAVKSGNMPAGGAGGQVLIKASDESFDWGYRSIQEIPGGGEKGYVLTKRSGADFDAGFEPVPPAPFDWTLLAEYKSAGTSTWTAPDVYSDGLPYEIGVFIIGAGGGGGVARSGNNASTCADASGGAAGYTASVIFEVTPGTNYPLVVGAKGAGALTTGTNTAVDGSGGGSSSFKGRIALGGAGGKGLKGSNVVFAVGADGGQGSDSYYTGEASALGCTPTFYISGTLEVLPAKSFPSMCFNPFTKQLCLGAGGHAHSGTQYGVQAQTAPTLPDGLSAGRGLANTSTAAQTGYSASSPGSGGGGVAVNLSSGMSNTALTAGSGADGAVYIYVRRPVR